MQQYTFDGLAENIEEFSKGGIYKLSIKEKFRILNGTNKNVRCKNCKYCKKINVNYKNYYKCEIMGITSSTATDIRLKDYGCNKFENKE